MGVVFTGTDHNGNHWHVTSWSDMDRYVRLTSTGKWSADRWQPDPPAVPAAILLAVEDTLNDN